ncbi:MAG: ComEC/Rec2 family competence protein [Mucilaginibacter sp.]
MIANHKGEIPFFLLLLPFLTGIGLAVNFPANHPGWLLFVFYIVSISFIILNLVYSRLALYKSKWIGGALIVVILIVSGYIITIKNNELNDGRHYCRQPAQYLVVKISNEPTFRNGYLRLTANVEKTIDKGKPLAATGTLLIVLKSNSDHLRYGDELLIPATYQPIAAPSNPAEFNYKRYLANQNIYYQAFLVPSQFAVLATNRGNPVIGYSLRLRQHLIDKLKRNMHDTSAVAVASTLILGYKADLSSDILQAYSKTGTIHVLSVSGAHVAIIYLLLAFALGFLNRYKYGKFAKASIIIILIWYYALLTGFSPAVSRAAVMISMVVAGKTFSRYINTLNILAVSAFVLLIYNPLFIMDVGFQLSYLAVFGLIVFQPVVYNWLQFKNRWADKLWSLCSVSIAAQVITFPLSAFYFHQFPVYFLISNLVIAVPVAIIMYSGVLYLLLPQISYLSKVIALVLEHAILVMNRFLVWIENLPFASISKIWLTTAEYLLLYVIIVGLFYFLYNQRIIMLKISLLCTLLLSISFSVKRIRSMRDNEIAWLNISKHKAIVFKYGNEAMVLTDLENTNKAWRYSVQPYLDSSRINNLRVLGLNQNIRTDWFIKKEGLVQFCNTRVLFLYDHFSGNGLAPKLRMDYIYLAENPRVNYNAISKSFDCQLLVIDGNNTDRYINNLKSDASRNKIAYKILKRNISLVTVSN